MGQTEFRRACEAFDLIAGERDWQAFARKFDSVLDGLDGDDLDVVGRLIQQLKEIRQSKRTGEAIDEFLQTLAPRAATTRETA